MKETEALWTKYFVQDFVELSFGHLGAGPRHAYERHEDWFMIDHVGHQADRNFLHPATHVQLLYSILLYVKILSTVLVNCLVMEGTGTVLLQ